MRSLTKKGGGDKILRYGAEYKQYLQSDLEPPPCTGCKEWIIERCADTRKECSRFQIFIRRRIPKRRG